VYCHTLTSCCAVLVFFCCARPVLVLTFVVALVGTWGLWRSFPSACRLVPSSAPGVQLTLPSNLSSDHWRVLPWPQPPSHSPNRWVPFITRFVCVFFSFSSLFLCVYVCGVCVCVSVCVCMCVCVCVCVLNGSLVQVVQAVTGKWLFYKRKC
jgi:hypothetical protein